MSLLLVIVVAALLLAGVLVLRHVTARGRSTARPRGHRSARAPFAGVEIVTGIDACAAVQRLQGQRFLATECPELPLPGCTRRQCECAFEKFADRREDTRRWADHGLDVTIFSGEERREPGRERRARRSRPAARR
jgi:hypothetical protein